MEQPPLTHYHVLGVEQDAHLRTIKAAYRQAVLRLHPDKAGGAGKPLPTADSGGPDALPGQGTPAPLAQAAAAARGNSFLMVQQAWEVLSDGERRAAYDRQLALAAAAAQVHVNETVQLPDMAEESIEGQRCHAWPCRCGGAFYLLDEDVAAAGGGGAGELLVPCSTCSLHIRVLLPGQQQQDQQQQRQRQQHL